MFFSKFSSVRKRGHFKAQGAVKKLTAAICPTVEDLESRTLMSFTAPVAYTTGTLNSAPHGIAVADFNHDGNLDMAIANNAGLSTVSIMLGNGDATFQPKTDFAAGTNADMMNAADINGDGNADLVVGGSYNMPTTVLLGNGDGTFAAPIMAVASGNAGHPMAVADFNGDGKADLAYVNLAAAINVSLGNGDGTFAAPLMYGAGGSLNAVTTGDFNGDGKIDLAAPNVYSLGTVSIMLNNGDGTFQPAKSYSAFSAPFAITTGDYNHDGRDDIAVANSYTSSAVTVLLCNPDGSFQPPTTYSMPYAPFELETGDFNNDGNEDVAERATNAIEVQLGKGDGTFYSPTATVTQSGPIGYAAVADFNHDGAADYIAPTNSGTIAVYANANNDRVAIGSAVALAISTPATTITANSPVAATVTALDANGNIAPDFVGTVYFASSDPNAKGQTVSYTFTSADAGVHSFLKTLTLTTVGTQTITATAPFMISAAVSVNVTPAATRYIISAPATANAGDTIAVTISAADALGNTAIGYSNTVHLISGDVQAGLPADYTFTASDAGTHTFNVTLKSAGSIYVGAQDTATFISGYSYVSVAAGAAASLSVVGGGGAIGVSRPVMVTAHDQFGNVATGYNGTLHFTSSDAGAILPADTALANGFGTVYVTLMNVGSQTITATDVANPNLTGTDLGVQAQPAALARFDIAGFPNVVAGNNGSFTIVARDTLGHVAANYSGTVYFSSSDVQAGLPASYTFNAADAGVHVFSATLKTAGVQSISAWDYAAGAGGTQTGISVTAAAPSTLSMTGPAAATAGTATSVTVTVRDAYGNLASTYTGTVKITSSDAQAVLPSNYKFAAADNGVHTFGVTLKTATIESITATDANVATMTATVGNIEVAAGAMTGFTLNPSSNPTAGTAMTVKVTAVDAYGNAIKNYAGTVHFSISVANSTIPVDYTFSAVDKGVHTFSLTVNTSGSVTLSVKDTVNPLLGATVTFNVGSGGGGGGGGGGTTSTGGGGTSTGGGGTSTGGGGGGGGKKVVV